MSLPPNLESLLASPAKAILPLVADDSVNNVVSTVVVSPLLNADRDETIIVKEPPSVFYQRLFHQTILLVMTQPNIHPADTM